jgi:hypothetical protein
LGNLKKISEGKFTVDVELFEALKGKKTTIGIYLKRGDLKLVGTRVVFYG